jgi:hypothetical protein
MESYIDILLGARIYVGPLLYNIDILKVCDDWLHRIMLDDI